MNERESNTVLITGASSGIGAELARVVASEGYNLVLTARREERLRDVADVVEDEHGVEAEVIPKDLSRLEAPQELYDETEGSGTKIHTLVNNAGFPVHGRFDESNLGAELDMIAVNITAVTHLSKLFIPEMVERGEGGLLNAASISSYYPTPKMSVYAATKAYVLSLSLALENEFRDDGVTVTAYAPGPAETEFMERGGVDESHIGSGITHDAETVARKAWSGYTTGKRVVYPSKSIWLFVQTGRFIPQKTAVSFGKNGVEQGLSYNPF